METLLDNINTAIKTIVTEYFTEYEKSVSKNVSEKFNLNYEDVRKVVSKVINDPLDNSIIEQTKGDISGTCSNACVGFTKAGKPCKYTCLAGKNMCNKHFKMKESNGDEGGVMNPNQGVVQKPDKKERKSKKNKTVNENPSFENTMTGLPSDEANWFRECAMKQPASAVREEGSTSMDGFRSAYYPDNDDSEVNSDDYILDE